MTKKIADLKPGTRFTYGTHNCMVLDHLEQGTLCMVLDSVKCKFGQNNNYAESELKEYLNEWYLDDWLNDGACCPYDRRTRGTGRAAPALWGAWGCQSVLRTGHALRAESFGPFGLWVLPAQYFPGCPICARAGLPRYSRRPAAAGG